MASPIGQTRVQANQTAAPQRTQQTNFQQAADRVGQTQAQNPTQSQQSQVSLSPEAQELTQGNATQGAQSNSGVSPDQLEQQIQSGDLQGALSTIYSMESSRPSQGNDPNESLKSQLKQQLQQGDQQSSESTFEQIKASRPAGGPQQQQQQQQR